MRNAMHVRDASVSLGCGSTRCHARAVIQVASILEPEGPNTAAFVCLLAAAMLMPQSSAWLSATAQAFAIARFSGEPGPQAGSVH